MSKYIDTRDICAETLIELAKDTRKIVVLDADVSKSTRTRLFGEIYPQRFFNVGAAEMNMAGIATGLASTGMIPFMSSFAVFLALRACEPIRTMISYPCSNVKILAGYSGLTAMQHGPTHQCLMDIAIMRAMPNMKIFSPSDSVSTRCLVEAAAKCQGPVYIRLGYNRQEALYNEGTLIEAEKVYVLKEGKDAVILSTGLIASRALKAANQLQKEGISIMVVDCPTIKPLPEVQILHIIKKIPKVITIEEHSIIGGFGSAIAELVTKNGLECRLKIMGIEDRYTESALYEELLDQYGLGIADIMQSVKSILGRDEPY